MDTSYIAQSRAVFKMSYVAADEEWVASEQFYR